MSSVVPELADRTVALFLPNWVGDAAMATPLLRALHQAAPPGTRFIGVMRPLMEDLFAGKRWWDETIFFEPHGSDPQHHSYAVAQKLRALDVETAVLTTNSLRPAAVAWWAGARHRIGYAKYGRGFLLTKRISVPRDKGKKIPYRMVDYYNELARVMGISTSSTQLELATTKADEAAADRVWLDLQLRPPQQTIIFNCSGAYGAAKLWPQEYFAELARRVASELDQDVLVLCGPAERERAQFIVKESRHPRVFSLADQPVSLGLSKACVKRCRLMVTTDSGPRQFAVAFEVPLVSLFGASYVIWGENPTANELPRKIDLDCSPCQKRQCPLQHHRCMRNLTVEHVFEGVVQQWQSTQKQAA
ncbi:ADP-heptose--lipooligosaccharide heptosyltransferase II [Planctomycetales bacterium 10988]|nr:ADP-heptose--lipooligosaccharide heptosyltransferase II [Planctomycetales bacterium 10988]